MRLITSLLLTSLCWFESLALYPDQVGMYDWHLENIGVIQNVVFQSKDAFVSTEEGVVAALNVRTGDLKWRKVLEPEDKIDGIALCKNHVVTLSKSGAYVRMWHAGEGTLLWDAATIATPPPLTLADVEGLTESAPARLVVLPGGEEVMVLANNAVYFFHPATGALAWQWYFDADAQAALAGRPLALTAVAAAPGEAGDALAAGYFVEGGGRRRLLAWALDRGAEAGAPLLAPEAAPAIAGAPVAVRTGADGRGVAAVAVAEDGGSLVVVARAEGGAGAGAAATGTVPLREGPWELATLPGSGDALLRLSNPATGEVEVLSLGADLSVATLLGCPAGGAGGCAVGAAGGAALARAYQASEDEVMLEVFRLAPGEGGGGAPAAGVAAAADAVAFPSAERGGPAGVFPQAFERPDGSLGARALLVGGDGSATGAQGGAALWVREEGLAAVGHAVFVDVPRRGDVGGAEDGDEDEHRLPGLAERLALQREALLEGLRAARGALAGALDPSRLVGGGGGGGRNAAAPNPAFGFDKLAVCLARGRKVYALRLLTGEVAWARLLPPPAGLGAPGEVAVTLFATRPTAVLGYAPEVAAVHAGPGGVVVQTLDGATGAVTGTHRLGALGGGGGGGGAVLLVPLAGLRDAHERRALLVVGPDGRCLPFPDAPEVRAGVAALLPRLFYHRVDPATGAVASHRVTPPPPAEGAAAFGSELFAAAALPVGAGGREALVAVAYPEVLEHESLPAQVLGDDSLLLKYLNPHLVVLASVAPAPAAAEEGGGTPTLFITLVDTVSGEVLHRLSHEHGTGPVHVTICENWVVYSFWEAKAHRTQIGALSLYEGFIDKHGLNPFTRPEQETHSSAFAAHPPIILQKTFVFPHAVRALGTTATAHGITAKHLLVALESGQVLGLDRRLVDPRRPEAPPKKQEAAEGLSQYDPFVPVVPPHMLSYFRRVERAARFYSVPTRVESTTLVLALGLDLYATRAQPSKTFDLLPEEFGRAALVAILAGMTAVTVALSRAVAAKQLRAKWA